MPNFGTGRTVEPGIGCQTIRKPKSRRSLPNTARRRTAPTNSESVRRSGKNTCRWRLMRRSLNQQIPPLRKGR